MGRRGPPKQPSQLRLLKGERRPSQINYDQPVPPAGAPEMPEWFDARHAALWHKTCRDLSAMHLLHSSDRETLIAYIRACIRHEDAARVVITGGVLVRSRADSLVRNPAIMAEAQAAEAVRRLAREFGLTPSARADLASGGNNQLPAERLLS